MQAECSKWVYFLLVPLSFSPPEINPPKLVGCRFQLNVSRPPFALCMSLSSLVKSAVGISLSSDIWVSFESLLLKSGRARGDNHTRFLLSLGCLVEHQLIALTPSCTEKWHLGRWMQNWTKSLATLESGFQKAPRRTLLSCLPLHVKFSPVLVHAKCPIDTRGAKNKLLQKPSLRM